ncbi:thiamine-phosphate kinase [Williamsia sp. MIQD14]|uniref:thiamine-phosphate kinase n=1 Tax=Williamsia sp. MIQD14 TaxID=3425703 RepID=UPI003DA10BE6
MGSGETAAQRAVDGAGGGAGPTVADVGERALIDRLTAVAQRSVPTDPGRGDVIVVGPGDDAAVLDLAGSLVVSTDSLVQDRHFRLEWSTPEQIGARAAVQSCADIAAMGARSVGIVVSIACPPSTPAEVVLGIDQGMNDAAAEFGARVVGGDLVAAGEMVVTVTVFGTTDGRPPVRLAGAAVGQTVAVSGPVGSSAAGLALLGAENGDFPELVAAHRVPVVDLRQGPVAADAGARAMTDVSDGLIDELETMAAASGVAVEVDTAAIPAHPRLRGAADAIGADMAQWQLGGGEDHQLLATFDGAPPAGWTVIGAVVAPGEGPRVRVDGAASPIRGWRSF